MPYLIEKCVLMIQVVFKCLKIMSNRELQFQLRRTFVFYYNRNV